MVGFKYVLGARTLRARLSFRPLNVASVEKIHVCPYHFIIQRGKFILFSNSSCQRKLPFPRSKFPRPIGLVPSGVHVHTSHLRTSTPHTHTSYESFVNKNAVYSGDLKMGVSTKNSKKLFTKTIRDEYRV